MVRELPHDSVSVQLLSKGESVEKSGVVVAFARLCSLIVETLSRILFLFELNGLQGARSHEQYQIQVGFHSREISENPCIHFVLMILSHGLEYAQ